MLHSLQVNGSTDEVINTVGVDGSCKLKLIEVVSHSESSPSLIYIVYVPAGNQAKSPFACQFVLSILYRMLPFVVLADTVIVPSEILHHVGSVLFELSIVITLACVVIVSLTAVASQALLVPTTL